MVPPGVAGNLDWGRDSGRVCFALLARVENNKKNSLLIRTIRYSRREFLFLAPTGSYMACMIQFRKTEFCVYRIKEFAVPFVLSSMKLKPVTISAQRGRIMSAIEESLEK